MATLAKRFWTLLSKEVDVAEIVKGGVDAANAVLGLAKTLNDNDVKTDLSVFVGQFSSLLEILNSPLGQVVGSTLPFLPIATGLLKFCIENSKSEPTLADCVALVSQAAYLESLRALLNLPENKAVLEQAGATPASQDMAQHLKKLGALELDDATARTAMICFHQSSLATAFNAVLSARLHQAGLPTPDAETFTQRVAWNTPRYLNQAIAAIADQVKPLADLYRNGGQQMLEKYTSLDAYLRDVISPDSPIAELKDRWRIFNEPFTLQELYVPLQAHPLDRNGDPRKDGIPVDLTTWAGQMLNDAQKQDRVLFIQAGPGRGKSAFCRMFAEAVRQHEHPRWTPILIRLRDIRTLEKDFEETLRKAVDRDFSRNDPGWLTDRNTRFLFLLDGFDELLMEGRTTAGLEDFLDQMGRFQRSCRDNPEKGHRVLITGRTLTLQTIERRMPDNLERMEILPLDDAQQHRWFANWARLAGSENALNLQRFLQDQRCPEAVQQLAREPLLLYLLAAMQRDAELNLEMFEQSGVTNAKVLIYARTLDWMLTTQRPAWLNQDLTELETESLRRILAEAGLCVVQSGGEAAPIAMIEQRLQGDDQVQELLETARQRLKDNPLKNALAAFYLQAGGDRSNGGSVEFIHKSFSEFLCAERLKESLEDWTRSGIKRQEFYISSEQLDWEIYDLLGSLVLHPEIVESVMALLTASPAFEPEKLFRRLHSFYLGWCNGEFLNAPPENLPQKKMRQMREQTRDPIWIGQRDVDIYAGLNVMILLLELHRYAQSNPKLKPQITFYPCGEWAGEEFHKIRLLQIIGYSESTGTGAFLKFVGKFLPQAALYGAGLQGVVLEGANLQGADLRIADLRGADLSNANLSGSQMRGAFLGRANLRGANLQGADLRGIFFDAADLRQADLCNANLEGATLSASFLKDADLRGANLRNANLYRASLENIAWDGQTSWEGVRGLETAVGIPAGLQMQGMGHGEDVAATQDDLERSSKHQALFSSPESAMPGERDDGVD